MTDIVERLRADAPRSPHTLLLKDNSLHLEAAAEIERLRTRQAIQFGMHPGGDLAKATQAEIERLRATINEQSAAIERADRLVLACEQHLRDAKHEIAKLRTDLREAGIIR